jgi:hypothetical protein
MIVVARRNESQFSSQISQGRSWQSFQRCFASSSNAFFDNNEKMYRCAESNVDPFRPDRLDDLGGDSVTAPGASGRNRAGSNVDVPTDVDCSAAMVVADILAPPALHQWSGIAQHGDPTLIVFRFKPINRKTLVVHRTGAPGRRFMKSSLKKAGSMARYVPEANPKSKVALFDQRNKAWKAK